MRVKTNTAGKITSADEGVSYAFFIFFILQAPSAFLSARASTGMYANHSPYGPICTGQFAGVALDLVEESSGAALQAS